MLVVIPFLAFVVCLPSVSLSGAFYSYNSREYPFNQFASNYHRNNFGQNPSITYRSGRSIVPSVPSVRNTAVIDVLPQSPTPIFAPIRGNWVVYPNLNQGNHYQTRIVPHPIGVNSIPVEYRPLPTIPYPYGPGFSHYPSTFVSPFRPTTIGTNHPNNILPPVITVPTYPPLPTGTGGGFTGTGGGFTGTSRVPTRIHPVGNDPFRPQIFPHIPAEKCDCRPPTDLRPIDRDDGTTTTTTTETPEGNGEEGNNGSSEEPSVESSTEEPTVESTTEESTDNDNNEDEEEKK